MPDWLGISVLELTLMEADVWVNVDVQYYNSLNTTVKTMGNHRRNEY